jgi:ABC-type uncharacterized transport system substrate-binding protein
VSLFRRRALSLALAAAPAAAWVRAAPAPRRVFHVMSFDSPWRWTDGQWTGFREGLADPGVQTQVFQMDVKRHATPEAKAERAQLALQAIRDWKPDLVYLSDDDAVAGVARPLAGTDLPLVFSGVNRSLAEHDLSGALNVTGVLEREHVVETLRLLKGLAPQVRRLAVISDGASYWDTVIGRVRERLAQVDGVVLARLDRVARFADYQQRLRECERTVDAVLHLGILTLAGDDGATVPYQTVQRWVAQHIRLPDASFWIDRIHHGTLASVTVSELEQGRAAGRLARAILHEARPPISLPVEATTKGRPALCLPRARQLGLKVPSSLLLSSDVVRTYAWDLA